jgi:hypothetical protein
MRKGRKVSKLSMVRLHQLLQFAEHLLVLEPHIVDGVDLLKPFHNVFGGVLGIRAICLFDAATETFYTSGSVARELEERTRRACRSGKAADDPEAGITIRCLSAAGRITGAVAFLGLEDAEKTAGPLLSVLAVLHERTRVRHKLGDELKGGLSAIMVAAGGIREAGPLSDVQSEMARIVEEEAARLAGIISSADSRNVLRPER